MERSSTILVCVVDISTGLDQHIDISEPSPVRRTECRPVKRRVATLVFGIDFRAGLE